MAPVVVKPMAALSRLGYEVDVVCAAPFSRYLESDESLLPYVEANFPNVTRVEPGRGLLDRIRLAFRRSAVTPDLMEVLNHQMYRALMDMDLGKYLVVMTWSPFHSINPVLVKVKKDNPEIKWVAQFSDPWAQNPLEHNNVTRRWAEKNEPNSLRDSDYIVHSSLNIQTLMAENSSVDILPKSEVVPHPFDSGLFPQRPKKKNSKIILRYVGVLFDKRSPEPLFKALSELLKSHPRLIEKIQLELIGSVPGEMLKTEVCLSLPEGMVRHLANMTYLESLGEMYDADILLLIDADVERNLFVPSKLSDYMGADTPIVGLVPSGASEDIFKGLECWHSRPNDITGIVKALESSIDYVLGGSKGSWCNEEYKALFSSDNVALQYMRIIEGLQND
ncbi:MAG: hypothetical protein JKY87_01880 [Mariprofundus sp.]|nr:hypothetical protein [Mariprofundus sp.]